VKLGKPVSRRGTTGHDGARRASFVVVLCFELVDPSMVDDPEHARELGPGGRRDESAGLGAEGSRRASPSGDVRLRAGRPPACLAARCRARRGSTNPLARAGPSQRDRERVKIVDRRLPPASAHLAVSVARSKLALLDGKAPGPRRSRRLGPRFYRELLGMVICHIMPFMAKSVRISDDLFSMARMEAAMMHRSVAQQIEHWAAIGQALEASGEMDDIRSYSISHMRARDHDRVRTGKARATDYHFFPRQWVRKAKLIWPTDAFAEYDTADDQAAGDHASRHSRRASGGRR
jgi:hypothetical protein